MGTVNVNWGMYDRTLDGKNTSGLVYLIDDPIPVLKYYQDIKNSLYRKCPAHTNYYKNTFVVCSPIDLEIELNKDNNWCNVITPKEFPKNLFNPRFSEEADSPYPIFSLGIPWIVATCKEKNVYIEQCEPVLDWERDPNIRIISGSFNIYKWVRPLEVAFEQRYKNMTIKFKRGQPLYYIRFVTEDPDDIVALNKVALSEETYKDVTRCIELKMFYPNKGLNFIYGLRQKFINSIKNKGR
jgi:hypothetical protein